MFKTLLLTALLFLPLSVFANKLTQIDDEITSVSTSITTSEKQQLKLQQQLQQVESQISQKSADIASTQKALRAQEEALLKLRKEQAEQMQVLTKEHEDLLKQLHAAYLLSREDYLKAFLNQQSLTSLNRTLQYYAYYNQKRVSIINYLKEVLSTLHNTEREIIATRVELNRLLLEHESKLAALQQSSQERERVLAALSKQITTSEQRLAQLRYDKQALNQAITKASEEVVVGDSGDFASHFGALPWPIQGKLAQRFNTREDGVPFNAVLISADAGLAVQAVYPGTVVYSGWLRGYGFLVIVDHGDGYMTLYGRNQSLLRAVGDTVSAGDALAIVGNSGGYDKSGLYFAIRHKGKPVNPELWHQPMGA